MREKLRRSLDSALQFEKLIELFQRAIKEEIEDEGNILSDELEVIMMSAYSRAEYLYHHLDEAVALINERRSVFGDGEGLEKRILGVDFGNGCEDPMKPYEYPDDFQSEWEVDDEDN